MSSTRVLTIDSDPDVACLLYTELQARGYEVTCASSVAEGIQIVKTLAPHVVLLDLNLPDSVGEDVITRLRHVSTAPIITVTARDSVAEKVRVLMLGADDYVLKPFQLPELLARIHVQLRHQRTRDLEISGVVMAPARREVRYRGQTIPLTVKEFELVWVLAQAPGKIFQREELSALLWKGARGDHGNVIDVHVSHIRSKLRHAHAPELIRTVRSYGYALTA